MKKIVSGLLAGFALGLIATWIYLRTHPEAGAPKTEAAAAPAAKPKENPLHLPPAKRAAAGLLLAQPATVTLAPEVSAFGRVLDPAPLIALVAELETARAALATSEKESARLEKLFAADTNVSAQAVDTAAAALARDRTAVASARARLLATWGRPLADAAKLDNIISELEKGAALVRLDLLPGDTPATDLKKAAVTLPGRAETFSADIIGAAPTADPQLQGAGFLAFIDGHTLPVGAALRATLAGPGEPQSALTVPRSAILYHEGSTWLYVLEEEDNFERKLVTLGRGVGDGVVITSGLDDSHQVVTAGAQQLLSAELQAGGAPSEG